MFLLWSITCFSLFLPVSGQGEDVFGFSRQEPSESPQYDTSIDKDPTVSSQQSQQDGNDDSMVSTLLVLLVSTVALVTLAYFLYEFFGTYLYYCWNGTAAEQQQEEGKPCESTAQRVGNSFSTYKQEFEDDDDDDDSSVSDLPMGSDDDDDDDILPQTKATADVSHESTV